MIASPASAATVCVVRDLHHRYGDHPALAGVDLEVSAGQIVALLGPNGSGKTTLFRLLCTLLPIQRGEIFIAGVDVASNPLAARNQFGIVFQSPSLDNKLTVDENIACQAALYGIKGAQLATRRDELLDQLALTDRRQDYCESLSGGLKRRVELVKGMLHRPRLLLLDEPSTGLDPAARLSFWDAIRGMAASGVAVLLTTHLLEEAEKADQVVILASGQVIAQGPPHQLRGELGDAVVTITAGDTDQVEQLLRTDLGLEPQHVHGQLRLQTAEAATLIPTLIDKLGDQADSISFGRPSLEDVFIAKTGHAFSESVT